MVASAPPSAFMLRVARASKVIKAVAGLCEQVAGLLRQIVHIVGWIVLLVGLVKLLVGPHWSLVQFVTPGAGVLAVLQGLIWPRRRYADEEVLLPDAPPEPGADLLPVDVDTGCETEAPATRSLDL